MRSMTGFGRASLHGSDRHIEVEVRSVNNRFLKIQMRVGRHLAAMEPRIESLLKERISRGTVSLVLRVEDDALPSGHRLDRALATRLHDEAKLLAQELGEDSTPSLADILKLPGVVVPSDSVDELPQALLDDLETSVRDAIDALVTMRTDEGSRLSKELKSITARIAVVVAQIKDRAPQLVVEYRDKLRQRLTKLLADLPGHGTLDESTLMREVAIMADRSDISEEIQRLESHLHQFDALTDEDVVGRRLDFLVQEMLRETNTIGSKASDAEVSGWVVEIKSELERLREQAQNVE